MNTLHFGHRLGILKALAVAAAALPLLGIAAGAQAAEQPVVLVFESVAGDGVSKDMAESATRAVRTYFRDTRRVEAVVVNAESPTVLRAVMEKKLTLEMLKNDTSRERRIEFARAMGFEYAAAAEVSIQKELSALVNGDMPKPPKGKEVGKDELSTVKADFVQVKVWLSRVEGRRDSWDSTKAAMITGSKDLDRDNALQSAVSSAVLDLTRKVFSEVPPAVNTTLPTGEQTTATTSDMPAASAPTAADYSARGDESVEIGNLALAIQQYSHAVSADPSNGKLRIKLAEAYARKKLYEQAEDELSRALVIGVDRALVDASRARVEQMKSGAAVPVEHESADPAKTVQDSAGQSGTENVTKPEPATPTLPPPAGGGVRLTRDSVTIATARLVQGDQLWNKGQPDAAALAYGEAVKLNPGDWRGHERLAAVNASMSLFAEARKAVEQLKRVQPDPPADTVLKRYEMFRKAFDRAFATLLTQMDSETADFEKKVITRESYYAAVNGIGIRLENMTRFLDALVVPASKEPANLRRSLACGLVAQAAASTLSYLETNNQTSKKNAETFLAQARKESAEAAKLDANKVVVTQEEPAAVEAVNAAETAPDTASTPDGEQETWDDGSYTEGSSELQP